MPGPRSEYEGRLRARREAAESRAQRRSSLGRVRLIVFALGAGLALLALRSDGPSGGWIAAPLAVFAYLVVAHDSATRAWMRATRAVEFYERGLANLDYAWTGRGNPGDRFVDAAHPYAVHLDLFGDGSVFERLCRAQTRAGEETLARWLLQPATPEEIRERQAAVVELRDALGLREDLAALARDVGATLHPDALAAWGEAPSLQIPATIRGIALLLSAAMAAAVGAALFVGTGLGPLLWMGLGEAVLALALRRRVLRILQGLDRPLRDLTLLVELLRRIERETFEAPLLVRLRAELDTHRTPPSREIARLHSRVRLLDARKNQLFAPLAPLLLWGTQLAFAIEAWRTECGPHLARWLQSIGELETLLDLAGYAYEAPEDPLPEIVDDGVVFDAEALGHPLLDPAVCVANDVRLDAKRPLLVISGSNMSGKSTLLRTVGVNAVLALAGAPVRAGRLQLSPLAVGPSIRILDSLAEGASRFYAEITCLRGIVERTEHGLPALFLLDEILGGTNSHDRGIGAAAIVHGLVERGALGLVTTHDLALTKIADDLAPRAANVHFEDQLVDGRMSFDYRLRDGVVTRSNALELMRSIGLEV